MAETVEQLLRRSERLAKLAMWMAILAIVSGMISIIALVMK